MKTLIILLLLTLSGCVSLDQAIQREGEMHGAPQVHIDAVKHGCLSGRAAGGSQDKFIKNYELYKSNEEYKMRYDDAYAMCKGKYEDTMRMIRGR